MLYSAKYAYIALFAVFLMCISIVSFLSSVTPSTLTVSWGLIVSFPNRIFVVLSVSLCLMKWIRLVLSVSKIAPLSFAYLSEYGMILS